MIIAIAIVYWLSCLGYMIAFVKEEDSVEGEDFVFHIIEWTACAIICSVLSPMLIGIDLQNKLNK